MATRRREDIISALLAKGFFRKSGDHHFFHYIENKSVFTKISHGSGYSFYNQGLLSKIKRQLRLSSNQQLLDFIDCPMSGEVYKSLLKEQKILK